jgi:formimidoylglutamate deiminase
MRDSRASICLGTDSNACISMLEEMRLCEYGQRLRDGRRGACTDAAGRIDVPLIDMATRGGAAALGLQAGVIAAGSLADFTCVDLDAPPLVGVQDGTLAAALITGGDVRCIAGTIIGGRRT